MRCSVPGVSTSDFLSLVLCVCVCPASATCAQGWLKNGGMCYGLFGSINKMTLSLNVNNVAPPITPLKWVDAAAACNSMGGNLASIASSGTQVGFKADIDFSVFRTWFCQPQMCTNGQTLIHVDFLLSFCYLLWYCTIAGHLLHYFQHAIPQARYLQV